MISDVLHSYRVYLFMQMHLLLYLEELQHEVDFPQYDIEDAVLKVSGKYLALEVRRRGINGSRTGYGRPPVFGKMMLPGLGKVNVGL